MKAKEVHINFSGKKKKILANIVPRYLEGIGLMFRRESKAKPLLFSFDNIREPIHSLFVFFNFYAIWMDKRFNVIEVKKVRPWSFYVNCRREFSYLLEIPVIYLEKEARRDLVDVLERFK